MKKKFGLLCLFWIDLIQCAEAPALVDVSNRIQSTLKKENDAIAVAVNQIRNSFFKENPALVQLIISYVASGTLFLRRCLQLESPVHELQALGNGQGAAIDTGGTWCVIDTLGQVQHRLKSEHAGRCLYKLFSTSFLYQSTDSAELSVVNVDKNYLRAQGLLVRALPMVIDMLAHVAVLCPEEILVVDSQGFHRISRIGQQVVQVKSLGKIDGATRIHCIESLGNNRIAVAFSTYDKEHHTRAVDLESFKKYVWDAQAFGAPQSMRLLAENQLLCVDNTVVQQSPRNTARAKPLTILYTRDLAAGRSDFDSLNVPAEVKCLQELPDQRVALGCSDGLIRIVDRIGKMRLFGELKGHKSGVHSLCLQTPTRLISASQDAAMQWDLEALNLPTRQITIKQPKTSTISCVAALSHRSIAVGCSNGAIELWEEGEPDKDKNDKLLQKRRSITPISNLAEAGKNITKKSSCSIS